MYWIYGMIFILSQISLIQCTPLIQGKFNLLCIVYDSSFSFPEHWIYFKVLANVCVCMLCVLISKTLARKSLYLCFIFMFFLLFSLQIKFLIDIAWKVKFFFLQFKFNIITSLTNAFLYVLQHTCLVLN